jgi:hypothetical protein
MQQSLQGFGQQALSSWEKQIWRNWLAIIKARTPSFHE